MKYSLAAAMIVLVGCNKPTPYQRFVLVPNPTGIQAAIPAGALALDTKTGQVCYTIGGPYTSGSPSIDMCYVLLKNHPD
jgi:hypothetical protein